MTSARSWLARNEIAVFAVLACVFGWVFSILHGFGGPATSDQLPLAPIIAAAIVSAGLGRPGIRSWGARLVNLRAAPAWYLVALVAPVAIIVAAVLANAALGAPLPTAAQLKGWTDLGPTFLGMLIAVGIGEEAGWTAFAAPILLTRHRFVGAWLILATIRVVWHLPLILHGDLTWTLGVGGNVAFQFLVLSLVRRSGTWFPAAIWHATLNTIGGSFIFRMVAGPDQARLGLLMVGGYALLAIAAWAFDSKWPGPNPDGLGREM